MPIAPPMIVYFLVRDQVEIQAYQTKTRRGGFIERKLQHKTKKKNIGCGHAKISHNFFLSLLLMGYRTFSSS